MIERIYLDTQIKSNVWKKIYNIESFIEKTCKKLIINSEIRKFLLKKDHSLEFSLALVSDSQIRKINHDFRGKNKATNVLSFPFIDEKLIKKYGLAKAAKPGKNLILGDIVLSLETTRKESLNSNCNFYEHLTHLLLHSILHLIGYDHIKDKDAREMEEIEINILQKLNIKNPYSA